MRFKHCRRITLEVVEADGRRSEVRIDDPVEAVCRAIEAARPGACVTRIKPQPKTRIVFLVDRGEWVPVAVGSVSDELPPNVERIECGNELAAEAYRQKFNELEIENPSGRWAISST